MFHFSISHLTLLQLSRRLVQTTKHPALSLQRSEEYKRDVDSQTSSVTHCCPVGARPQPDTCSCSSRRPERTAAAA